MLSAGLEKKLHLRGFYCICICIFLILFQNGLLSKPEARYQTQLLKRKNQWCHNLNAINSGSLFIAAIFSVQIWVSGRTIESFCSLFICSYYSLQIKIIKRQFRVDFDICIVIKIDNHSSLFHVISIKLNISIYSSIISIFSRMREIVWIYSKICDKHAMILDRSNAAFVIEIAKEFQQVIHKSAQNVVRKITQNVCAKSIDSSIFAHEC